MVDFYGRGMANQKMLSLFEPKVIFGPDALILEKRGVNTGRKVQRAAD
jgi:hypothetical protein